MVGDKKLTVTTGQHPRQNSHRHRANGVIGRGGIGPKSSGVGVFGGRAKGEGNRI